MRSVGDSSFDSSPASATHTLNVDPGAYSPAEALLISGAFLSLVQAIHCAWLTPLSNSDGSKDGVVVIASTSPLRQSITTADALSSPSRVSTCCCNSTS